MSRLFALLRDLAYFQRTEADRGAVAQQLGRLRATVEKQDFDGTEREHLAWLGTAVESALAGG